MAAPTSAQDIFVSKFDSTGTLLWTQQLGTQTYEASDAIAVDGQGNTYITGWTWGDLGGPNAGQCDAYLSRLDGSGTLLWTRQTGTTDLDCGDSVAVDGQANCYMSWGSVTDVPFYIRVVLDANRS